MQYHYVPAKEVDAVELTEKEFKLLCGENKAVYNIDLIRGEIPQLIEDLAKKKIAVRLDSYAGAEKVVIDVRDRERKSKSVVAYHRANCR